MSYFSCLGVKDWKLEDAINNPDDGKSSLQLVLDDLAKLVEGDHLTIAHRITDTSFQHVPAHCPKLTSLCIKHSPMTHVSMVAVAQHCRRLATLQLEQCEHVDGPWFDALFQGRCPLTSVIISGCQPHDMTRDEAKARSGQVSLTLSPFSTLTSLDTINYGELTTDFINRKTIYAWPHLTNLQLNSCEHINDDNAILFLQAHRHLQYLAMNHSIKITDRTLEAMAAYFPNIRRIQVEWSPGITASGVYRVVQQCPSLVTIHIQGCDIHVYDDDFPRDLDADRYCVPDDGFYDVESWSERDYDELLWMIGMAYETDDDNDSSDPGNDDSSDPNNNDDDPTDGEQ